MYPYNKISNVQFQAPPGRGFKDSIFFSFSSAVLQKQFLKEKNIRNVQETLDYITYMSKAIEDMLLRGDTN